MTWRPSWWTREEYQRSCEGFELMSHCPRCKLRLEDNLSCKLCPRCRTAYFPVPGYEKLEAEEILAALAGDEP